MKEGSSRSRSQRANQIPVTTDSDDLSGMKSTKMKISTDTCEMKNAIAIAGPPAKPFILLVGRIRFWLPGFSGILFLLNVNPISSVVTLATAV